MFPVEIWEIILAKFAEDGNPVQLVRMKRVCKNWYAIISQLIAKTGTQWYEKCVDDVPERFWSALLEQQNHAVISCVNFHEAKRQPYVWIALHTSWVEWQTLMEKNPSVETFIGLPDARLLEHITCIATYRTILAVGDSKGYVVFFDMSKNRTLPFFEAYHGSVLREVIFWRKGTELTAVSMCTEGNIKYWDVNARRQKFENRETRGSMLSSSFDFCFSVDQNVAEVKKAILEVERWLKPNKTDQRQLQLNFDEKSVAIVGDRNKVMLWVEGDRHIQYVETPTEIYTLHPYMIRKPKQAHSRYVIFKPNVAAFVGEVRHFGFSVAARQWKIYDSYERFTSPVTAILFHMIYLVLGLASGDLHIFYVKDYRTNLENFDFRTARSKRISLGKEPIASIKLGEFGMNKIFVASTRRKIHVMKFEEMGY